MKQPQYAEQLYEAAKPAFGLLLGLHPGDEEACEDGQCATCRVLGDLGFGLDLVEGRVPEEDEPDVREAVSV